MNTTTLDSATITRNRNTSSGLLVLALAVACALAYTAALVPTVALYGGLAVATVLVTRRVARVLRWRREDRADALTAAAWRAAHPRPARTLSGVS